jgi:protein-tyrosine phosphatase
MAGVSRSATLAIAYIMKTEKILFDEAFARVQEKRPIV